MWPAKVLMVAPKGFKIQYSINPHMVGQDGKLKTVDLNTAWTQWETLKQHFVDLNLKVDVIEGHDEYPDMVFCANPFFPFLKNGSPAIILSNMNSPFRKQEPALMKEWAVKNDIQCFHLKGDESFEGMGDALWNYETDEIFGGHGFRTNPKAYDEVEAITGKTVHRLELVDEHFYHLDTCLCILNKNSALYIPEAFNEDGRKLLTSKFKNLMPIPYQEACNSFAGNACSVNGKDVILPRGCLQTRIQLERHNFVVRETDTSEFIKSGGSVFCMKMLYW